MKKKIIDLKNKIAVFFIDVKNKVVPLIKANKKISIAVGIILLVVLLSIIIASTKKEIGNSNSNLNNLGFTVEKDGEIYYLGFENGNQNGIYKVKGNKKEKVTSEYGLYLNIVGKFIYYIDEEENAIVKIKTNGKDKKTIVENVDLEKMVIADGWIYYSQDSNFYKIKLNGKDKKRLTKKSIECYEIEGNSIYYSYINDGKYVIAKMDTSGENITKIDSNAGKSFFIKENYIYYIYENYNLENYEYNYELYKMKINGKNKEKVANIDGSLDIDTVNFVKNEIYYLKTDEDGNVAIFSIKINGKNETKIVEIEKGHSTPINVVGNWIYYPENNENQETEMVRVKTNGKDKQNLAL